MAKYAPSEAGNSCHIHMSLWKKAKTRFGMSLARRSRRSTRHAADVSPASAGSKLFRQFLGGLLKYSPELCLFFGPTINSYKRYQPGSWAPTRMAWALDNRTVGFRVVGEDKAFRIENRMPGADANPYLAFAAMIAAGMAGISEGLDCGEQYLGNAYVDPKLARSAEHPCDGRRLARPIKIRPRFWRCRGGLLRSPRASRNRGLQQRGHRLGKEPALRADLAAWYFTFGRIVDFSAAAIHGKVPCSRPDRTTKDKKGRMSRAAKTLSFKGRGQGEG